MQHAPTHAATSAAINEAPPSIVFPLVFPPLGGAVAARLADGELRVSYSGPEPFGGDVRELLGAVAEHLDAARRSRFIVERLHFEAAFMDESDSDADDFTHGCEGDDE